MDSPARSPIWNQWLREAGQEFLIQPGGMSAPIQPARVQVHTEAVLGAFHVWVTALAPHRAPMHLVLGHGRVSVCATRGADHLAITLASAGLPEGLDMEGAISHRHGDTTHLIVPFDRTQPDPALPRRLSRWMPLQ